MRELFKEGLDVRYGKTMVGAKIDEEEGKVVVEFADGEKVMGDVLVGCDGAKSRVRGVLCGKDAELTDVPVSMFNFPYQFDADTARRIRAMNELFITCIHPEHGSMFWLSSKYPISQLSFTCFVVMEKKLLMSGCSSRRTPLHPRRPINIHIPSPPLVPRLFPSPWHRPLHPSLPHGLFQIPRS
jgi:hypothetical protein